MATAVTIQPTVLECKDTSERIDLCEAYGLYIKPIARLNITIQLPPTKIAGQSVPTAEIIDKLRKHSQPEEYTMLRVIKNTLEFIRFEAEIENKSALKGLLARLDNSSMKMLSYTDVLKIRAAEAKITYPLKHDWDSFFNCVNTTSVNDLKSGERPDTLHLQDLPCKWFSERKAVAFGDVKKPSETILKEVFSIFGEIRCIDIPMLYNQKFYLQKSEMFDAYVQYKEYFSFVKAMDTFRGMKMLHVDSGVAQTASIRVDFDRTKHLSEREIQKRSIDRLKAAEMEKIRSAQLEREKERAARKLEMPSFKQIMEDAAVTQKDENATASANSADEGKTKEQRRREREEIRRQRRLTKKQEDEEKKYSLKIELEERRILIAQRKLESMRLLEELFTRVKNSFPYDEYKSEESIIDEEKKNDLPAEQIASDGEKLKEVDQNSQATAVTEDKKIMEEISDESLVIEPSGPVTPATVETPKEDEDSKAASSSATKENDHDTKEEEEEDVGAVEGEKSPSRKKAKKEKKEKKRKRHSRDKDDEYDLREKIMRLKSNDPRSSIEEDYINF